MFKKIQDWWMRLAVAYQAQKDKNKEFHRCAECKKLYLFDVPPGVTSNEVDFVCGKCVNKGK